MPSDARTDCSTVLVTSLALVDQFQKSLSSSVSTNADSSSSGEHPSPLLLLKTAAESLKSTTTKLSLLSITPPFTGSAIVSLLKPLNDSILPSLVTAALLVTPSQFPDAFASEASRISNGVLSELRGLLILIDSRAKSLTLTEEVPLAEKQSITEATGRVWENCDAIILFANAGIPSFVVKKAEQWLALMKDAVQELQEWDPEEDVDDDLFGDDDDADSDDGSDQESGDKSGGKDQDEATIAAGVKEQVLKVLSRVPQSIHVVVKQRLAKMPPDLLETSNNTMTQNKTTINDILKNARHVSECIDESAESMYMGNPELCLKKAGEARALTINVVESVLQPWRPSTDGKEAKEDAFIKRALLWIQQVDTKPATSVTNRTTD